MKARIVFNETATGAETTFDSEIAELSASSILDAINRYQLESGDEDEDSIIKVKMESFVAQGSHAAFILSSPEDTVYFGSMLWTGLVYTQFV